jgi:F-type H+-transporting ATPase subunit epsilon
VKLSVTTPRGALVDTDVDEIVAPGELGELGVLPGHVPMMSALKPGVLVYKTRDHTGVVAVGPGFLQVAPMPTAEPARDRVLVLVDRAVAAGTIDRAAAEKELADADRELAAWKRDLDGAYHALLVRRQWAQARLDASARSGAGPHASA